MRKFIRFFLTGPGAVLVVVAIAITMACIIRQGQDRVRFIRSWMSPKVVEIAFPGESRRKKFQWLSKAKYRAVDAIAQQSGRRGRKPVEPRNKRNPKAVMSEHDKNLFIEKHTDGYAILRGGVKKPLAVEPTQDAAIDKARQLDPDAAIHVERVRNAKGGGRDKWRRIS
jgi:hypothetical protein